MAINLKPTEAMAAEAKRGLDWRKEYGRGGTAVGVARARDISNRTNLSESTVRRMVSYFARHEVDKKGEGFSPGEDGYPSAGRIAWALWGGDPGKSWAEEKSRQLDKEKKENSMNITIQNRAGKLKLNDGVHKESADKLIEELNHLYGPDAVAAKMVIGEAVCVAEDALETVEVEINSPGGSVIEGTRIYNALREMSSRGVEVTTVVNGLAASMGSVILMAGDKRRMTKGSRIMIHEASMYSWGDARTLKKNAELLEGISSELAGIYADRTGGDAKTIRNLMLAETWMDSEQALANNFVDSIVDYDKKKQDAEASFDTEAKGMTGILSKLFPGNENVEQIEAQIAEIETLRADLTEAQARIAELAPLAEANAALQADLSEAQAKLDAADKLANENAQAISELTEKAQVSDKKISVRASEFLAAQGHPQPVTVEDDGTEKGNAYEQYRELKKSDPQGATQFWNENKDAIMACR